MKNQSSTFSKAVSGLVVIVLMLILAGFLGSTFNTKDTFLDDMLRGVGFCSFLFIVYIWVDGMSSGYSDKDQDDDKKGDQ